MAAPDPAIEAAAAAAGQPPGWRAALAAVAGSVMVGFMPLMTLQLYKAGISAPSMLVWRYALALVPLTAAAALAGHDLGAALRAGAWRIMLVGATLGAGQTLCFWESLHTLDTSIVVLLFYTYPALTLILDRLVFKRPIQLRAALCVAMILVGAGLITVPGLRGGGLDPRGLAWILPSPVIYTLYLAANSVLMRRHPPLIGAVFLYLGLAATFAGASLYLGLDIPAAPGTWLLVLIDRSRSGGADRHPVFLQRAEARRRELCSHRQLRADHGHPRRRAGAGRKADRGAGGRRRSDPLRHRPARDFPQTENALIPALRPEQVFPVSNRIMRVRYTQFD